MAKAARHNPETGRVEVVDVPQPAAAQPPDFAQRPEIKVSLKNLIRYLSQGQKTALVNHLAGLSAEVRIELELNNYFVPSRSSEYTALFGVQDLREITGE